MFKIIALVTIFLAGFNPQSFSAKQGEDIKSNYHNWNNLVGEMPEVVVTAIRPTEHEMRSFGLLPEIIISADAENDGNSMLPTIEVTAIKPTQEELQLIGVMPEIVITAPRYQSKGTGVARDNLKTKTGGKDV
jgi:hypothetical protein